MIYYDNYVCSLTFRFPRYKKYMHTRDPAELLERNGLACARYTQVTTLKRFIFSSKPKQNNNNMHVK